jgi:DNA-binding transcriptional LysR family regulator
VYAFGQRIAKPYLYVYLGLVFMGAAVLEFAASIREGVASIGFCWDAAETGLLHTRTYRHDHLSVAVPKGHPLCALPAVRYADTLDFEHVIMPVNSAVEVMLQREAGLLG